MTRSWLLVWGIALLLANAAFADDSQPAAADKPLKKAGEWNQSKIVVRGKDVEHWLNGKKVLAYNLDSPEVKALQAKAKEKA